MPGSAVKVIEYWKLWPSVDWSTNSSWGYYKNVGLSPEEISSMIDREVFFPIRKSQTSLRTD